MDLKMTNKRFTYENHKVKDNLTGEVHSSNMVSVNVLNQLNDENEQLKAENRKLRFENGKLTHDLFWANKMVEELKGVDVE